MRDGTPGYVSLSAARSVMTPRAPLPRVDHLVLFICTVFVLEGYGRVMALLVYIRDWTSGVLLRLREMWMGVDVAFGLVGGG